jgi:pimeloyl-ACP methyl ester carboxylesterase
MQRDTFLFVSGAWHGSWCWHRVAQHLAQAGHTVLAPDLPGYRTDCTPAHAVSLETWTRYICEVLEAQREPMTLVGHSRGGIVISQVAERMPHKVRALIYVSGFLLQSGESILRALRKDGTSTLLRHVNLTDDRSRWLVEDTAIEELFYGECSDGDVEFARARLAPEPAEPLMTPVEITEERFGTVPRIYIECLRDQAVPLALQRRMHTALPCSRVISLDTDHSPFFSAPGELATQISSASALVAH